MDTGIIMVGGIAIGATGIGATVIIAAITSSIAGTIITTHFSRLTGATSTRGTATASVCAGGERGVKGEQSGAPGNVPALSFCAVGSARIFFQRRRNAEIVRLGVASAATPKCKITSKYGLRYMSWGCVACALDASARGLSNAAL
jgi:hypothetical protein